MPLRMSEIYGRIVSYLFVRNACGFLSLKFAKLIEYRPRISASGYESAFLSLKHYQIGREKLG